MRVSGAIKAQFGDICSHYKPQYAAWEVVEYLRKLVFAGLLGSGVFGKQGSIQQLFVGNVLACVFMCLTIWFLPFRSTDLNFTKFINDAFFFMLMMASLAVRIHLAASGSDEETTCLDLASGDDTDTDTQDHKTSEEVVGVFGSYLNLWSLALVCMLIFRKFSLRSIVTAMLLRVPTQVTEGLAMVQHMAQDDPEPDKKQETKTQTKKEKKGCDCKGLVASCLLGPPKFIFKVATGNLWGSESVDAKTYTVFLLMSWGLALWLGTLLVAQASTIGAREESACPCESLVYPRWPRAALTKTASALWFFGWLALMTWHQTRFGTWFPRLKVNASKSKGAGKNRKGEAEAEELTFNPLQTGGDANVRASATESGEDSTDGDSKSKKADKTKKKKKDKKRDKGASREIEFAPDPSRETEFAPFGADTPSVSATPFATFDIEEGARSEAPDGQAQKGNTPAASAMDSGARAMDGEADASAPSAAGIMQRQRVDSEQGGDYEEGDDT